MQSLSVCSHGLRRLTILLACLGMSACNTSDVPISKVSGTISYNGTPLPGGSVTLLSESGFGASAQIQRDGTFQFVSQHGKGIPLGEYKVTVWVPLPGEVDPGAPGMAELLESVKGIVVPKKFQDPSTSGLVTTVTDGPNTLDLKLVD